MTAREAILRAIVTAGGRPQASPATITAEALDLLRSPEALRPALPSADVVESFVRRASGPKVGATVDRIAALADLPAALAGYLATRRLGGGIALQPSPKLAALDWAASGLLPGHPVDDGVAVTVAHWGIAETGSVVVHSAPDMPILHNFLAAVHIVALPVAAIVPHLEDYAAAARAAGDPAPRNACIITGASGTTDIEGSMVRGAHGPRHLHIILIDRPKAEPE